MNELVQILIWLLVFGVVLYIVYYILGMIAIPAPMKNIVLLIVGVIAIIVLLERFIPMLSAGHL